MKAKILLFFAFPVLAWLAVTLFVHDRVAGTVALVADELRPLIALSYEGVTVGLDGRVGLRGVTMRPGALGEQLSIGELSIKLPNVRYLLELQQRLERHQFPQELSVRALDVAFSTRGPLARRWEAAMFADDPARRGRALSSCVGRSSLPTQMHLLDYDEIRADVEVGYRFDEQDQEVVLYGSGGQMDGVEFRGELAMVMRAMDVLNLMRVTSSPKVVRASLEVSDDGYYDRVFRHCESDKLSKPVVVDLLAANLVAMFDGLPLKPDAPLLAAYSQFVSSGKRLIVTARPPRPQNLLQLSRYEPADVPALLNVRTRVN